MAPTKSLEWEMVGLSPAHRRAHCPQNLDPASRRSELELSEYSTEELRAELSRRGEISTTEYELVAIDSIKRDDKPSVLDKLTIAVLGIAGEAGEVSDLLKKHLDRGNPIDTEQWLDEGGDVLWHLAYFARQLGSNLNEMMQRNLTKIRRRFPEGQFTREAANAKREIDSPISPAIIQKLMQASGVLK